MSQYEKLPQRVKEIRKRANRNWYNRNRAKCAIFFINWRKKRMSWYQSLKEGKSCKYCGESELVCLDYHHRNPTEKNGLPREIAKKTSDNNKVLREIIKCDLICANCHRKITAGKMIIKK